MNEKTNPPGAVAPGGVAGDGRLDAAVARLRSVSLRRARELIAAGAVKVGGQIEKRKGLRVADPHTVEIEGAADEGGVPPAILVARPIPLDVLYEDASLIAVNKPAGMPSHPLRAGEGDTVASGIVARFPECAAASADAREGGLAHRLDHGTSGVLIAARSRAAWTALRMALSEGRCEKSYLAEVVGVPSTREVITAPIGRGGPRGGKARIGTGRDPLPAYTSFDRVEDRGGTALVRATLSSGRPHQVRVHLAHLGFPVLGDELYGNEETMRVARERAVTGFRLHAERVSFVHPVSGERTVIEAPPPEWARPGAG